VAYNASYVYFIVADGWNRGVSEGISISELGVFARDTLLATDAVTLDSQAISQIAEINGIDELSWSAAPGAGWVTLASSTGTLPTQPVVSVKKSSLANGWQISSVSFSSTDGALNAIVTVRAYLGTLSKIYMPVIR